MSDRYPGTITIGGDLPRSKLAEFLEVCRDSGASPDWDGGFPEEVKTEKHLLALLDKGGHLYLMDCQASGGTFNSLMDWLESNTIAYDAWADSYCDYEASIVKFRPGWGKGNILSSTDCRELIELGPVLKAREALNVGNVHAAMKYLDDVVRDFKDMPELPKFRCVDG